MTHEEFLDEPDELVTWMLQIAAAADRAERRQIERAREG